MPNDKGLNFSIDILSEVSNIGSGNAATALHDMLKKKVKLNVPSVKMCSMEEAKQAHSTEEPKNIILFNTTGCLEGFLLFLVDQKDLNNIFDIVGHGYTIDADAVALEVANIICGSYVSAISELMGSRASISPPQIAYDMFGALIDSLVAAMCDDVDEILLMHTLMQVEDLSINGSFMFLLRKDTINNMLERMYEKYEN